MVTWRRVSGLIASEPSKLRLPELRQLGNSTLQSST